VNVPEEVDRVLAARALPGLLDCDRDDGWGHRVYEPRAVVAERFEVVERELVVTLLFLSFRRANRSSSGRPAAAYRSATSAISGMLW
jgi:hypothetical protein